jgi:hypothetical protein
MPGTDAVVRGKQTFQLGEEAKVLEVLVGILIIPTYAPLKSVGELDSKKPIVTGESTTHSTITPCKREHCCIEECNRYRTT